MPLSEADRAWIAKKKSSGATRKIGSDKEEADFAQQYQKITGTSPLLQALGRRTINSLTAGATEGLAEEVGVPAPQSLGTVGDFLTEVAGGIGFGGGAKLGTQAALRIAPKVAEMAKATPRLFNIGAGAVENALYSGSRAGFEDADVASAAGWGAGIGGGITAALHLPGAVISAAQTRLLDPTGWVQKKLLKIGAEGGENPRVTAFMRKIGIEPTPDMLNPRNRVAQYAGAKMGQMTAAKNKANDYIAAFNSGMKDEATAISRMIPTVLPPAQPAAGGTILRGSFHVMAQGPRKLAQEGYDLVRDEIGERPVDILNLSTLLDDLQRDVDAYAPVMSSVAELKRVVTTLRNKLITNTDTTLLPTMASTEAEVMSALTGPKWSEVWDTIKALYPNTAQKMKWDQGDIASARAWSRLKDFLRNEADLAVDEAASAGEAATKVLNPNIREVLDASDAHWAIYKGLYEEPRGLGEVGQLLMSKAHPEQVLPRLTADVTMLRKTEQWATRATGDNPAIGKLWHDTLAQWKTKQLLDDSFIDDPDIVNKASDERVAFYYKRLKDQVQQLGPEYITELFRYQPEALAALREMQYVGQETLPALLNIHPKAESFGGGTEQASAITTMSSARRAVKILASFASGSMAAERFMAPATTNPFMGGRAPMRPNTAPVINTLRRATMGPMQSAIAPPPVTAGTPDDSMSVLQQMPR